MSSDYGKLTVADVMSKEIITCPADARLGDVAALLSRRGVHAVFVLDASGQPAGVVSDFDLLVGEWLADDAKALEAMRTMTARELMTSPLETIAAAAPAAQAATKLRELHLNRLLVLDDAGAATGVVSVSDLIAPLGTPSTARATVGDVMSYAIVTCPPSTTLASAARAMTERRSRSVIVVDEDGRAVGLLTGHDVLSLYDRGDAQTKVVDLMSSPLITVSSSLALPDAAELMVRHEVHRLVVLDPDGQDGAPIGILSTSDIVAEMAQETSVWRRLDG